MLPGQVLKVLLVGVLDHPRSSSTGILGIVLNGGIGTGR